MTNPKSNTIISALPPELSPLDALSYLLDIGVDDVVESHPINRFVAVAATRVAPHAAQVSAEKTTLTSDTETIEDTTKTEIADGQQVAMAAAQAANTIAALQSAVEAFDGLPSRITANRTVFSDGNPDARVMIISEGPNLDGDREGVPLAGASGILLDRMLASIGLDRDSVYIANIMPWRPAGNRLPSPAELQIMLPFTQRHMELIAPDVVVPLGESASRAVLQKNDRMSQLRGIWGDAVGMTTPYPALPMFHPSYLLRTPVAKRKMWRDILTLSKFLAENI